MGQSFAGKIMGNGGNHMGGQYPGLGPVGTGFNQTPTDGMNHTMGGGGGLGGMMSSLLGGGHDAHEGKHGKKDKKDKKDKKGKQKCEAETSNKGKESEEGGEKPSPTGKMFVFGGKSNGYLNDLWQFDSGSSFSGQHQSSSFITVN